MKKNKYIETAEIPTAFISIGNADELAEFNKKRTLFFACISYDRAMATCRWCMMEHYSKYELGWGNRYNKWSYDSEQCKDADARSRGWLMSEQNEEEAE